MSDPVSLSAKRLDIQGLRMVAVLVVVADHLTGWPAGGFVGVDVFFVISGFLITGRLLKTAGTVSVGRYFGTFYRLRALRILPAAIVTLVGTLIAARFAFNDDRFAAITDDATWSAIFGANWHFAANGTDYLQADGPISPLQHYWSLSVEEQFYLLWPVLLLALVPLAALSRGDRQRSARIAAGSAAVVVGAVSLVWAWHESASNPTSAYFSSFTRAWELCAGALLACALPAVRRPDRAVLATALSWSGLGVIVASLFLINDTSTFPAPGALLPVAGSMLVLIGGALGEPRNLALTNPVAVWIGDLSYSIYLVHFPAVIILGSLIPNDTHLRWMVVGVATFGLAMASYYLVEEPVRTRFARPYPHRNLRWRAGVAVALCCTAVTAMTFRTPTPTIHLAASALQENQPNAVPPTTQLKNELVTAVTGTDVEDVSNDDETGSEAAHADWARCDTETKIRRSCTFEPTEPTADSRTVLVVGDSMALSYLPAVRAALGRTWTVIGFAKQLCPAADVPMNQTGTDVLFKACDRHHDAYERISATVDPDLVILTGSARTISNMHGVQTRAAYRRGLTETITTFSGRGRSVVVLSPPPDGRNLEDCDIQGATAADCTARIRARQRIQDGVDRRTAAATGATYLNAEELFCVGGYCPAVVDNLAVRYDRLHITPTYGESIAPSLAPALRSAL